MSRLFAFILALVTLVTYPIAAGAATVTLTGTDIVYEYDTDANVAALDLFGTPSVVGNAVRFMPGEFRAQSLNGEGAVVESANFVFDRVYALNGDAIRKINVFEFGDYEVANGGQVSADVLLTAVSNNGFDLSFGGDAFDAAGDSGGKQTWDISTVVNPASEFATAATDIALSVQNTLTATTSNPGDIAWIQKKVVFAATTVVPLPAAAWLFGSALLGLVLVARREHR